MSIKSSLTQPKKYLKQRILFFCGHLISLPVSFIFSHSLLLNAQSKALMETWLLTVGKTLMLVVSVNTGQVIEEEKKADHCDRGKVQGKQQMRAK